MHRLFSLLVISMIAAALLAAIDSPVMSGDKEEPGRQFAGKILSILRKSGPGDSANYLEKVRIAKLEDRSFLVGTGVDIPDNWQRGRTVWIALDDIGEMTVFDTLEELKKAIEEADPKLAPPAKT